ncbi:hypothetical protein ACJRO7_024421 [Eucalyptus globulus]|uniref:non-specific serine/threonine protein kinase n=1 Tax=Eucalyptus globulus TaxID=34317 RepID=A0ABD3K7K5_EUCGL
MNTHLLLLCAMFLVVMINRTQSQGNEDLYLSCSNLCNCRNIQDVGFPFWGGNPSRSCGHPALQLACEDNAASITMYNVKYKVLDFYPSTKVLQIVREDIFTEICPPNFTHTTLDPALFSEINHYDYINSTFLYDGSSDFSCTSSDVSVVVGRAVGPGTCFGSVVSFTSRSILHEGNTTKILQQGFKVKFKDSAVCTGCTQSKGACGYDISKNSTACYCPDGSSGSATCSPPAAGGPQGQPGSKGFNKPSKFFAGGALAISVSISAIAIIFLLKNKNEIFSGKVLLFKNRKYRNIEKLMRIHGSLVPRRYHYIDVKKMTNSFSEKLGQGGFGAVYKGKIGDGSLVAVKILIESKSSLEEFINEVVSFSRTSHINVISLLGFCYERNKRALIFEYMPNGSLDMFISSGKTLNMSRWKILYKIAIGIARGLEYLHRGCNTRILHFDIKPQNILLDQDFIPKISDFGLAKLCHGKDSAVSTLGMRGTVGFIAPEVVFRNLGRISHKSDVYSYGMLVLEMIGFRNSNIKVSNSSDMYFPEWIYRNLEHGKDLKLPMNVTEEEEVLVRMMIIVSLWCIQTNPSNRPPIMKVIEMLEGSFESLQMPPKPILYSPTQPPSQHWEMMTLNSNGSVEDRILENTEESNDT